MATLPGRLSTVNFHRITSSLFKVLREVKCMPASKDGCVIMLKRGMSGGANQQKFLIRPASFTDKQHLIRARNYLFLTGVPLGIFITFVNVFIGPAQLAEIPEGYDPKHWEYYEHPITRFIARYIIPSPQQEYEKMAHFLDIHARKKVNREEMVKVKKIMKERSDGYYTYLPAALPPLHKNDDN